MFFKAIGIDYLSARWTDGTFSVIYLQREIELLEFRGGFARKPPRNGHLFGYEPGSRRFTVSAGGNLRGKLLTQAYGENFSVRGCFCVRLIEIKID